jgi:hypothetical protein
MNILDAMAGLNKDAAGSIKYRAQVTLGDLEFPEPCIITPQIQVASTVRGTVGNQRRDPVVNYGGISGVYLNIEFFAGNFVSPLLDSALGESTEGVPGAEDLIDLGSAAFGLLEVWSMKLEEFVPQLLDLYDNQPAPWPIIDTKGVLLHYNVQYVTPTAAPQFTPVGKTNRLYKVVMQFVRQNPYQDGSIYRQVTE